MKGVTYQVLIDAAGLQLLQLCNALLLLLDDYNDARDQGSLSRKPKSLTLHG
jgi:uncharacterized protein YxjI